MSKRLLNGICLLLFGGSILLVVAAFFIWNDPTEYIVEDSGGITQLTIDQCNLMKRNKKTMVRGWAYIQKQPHASYSVYAELSNNRYRKFETFSESRADVVNALELDPAYKLVGFKAGYRNLSTSYTGKIVVHATNATGEVFSASYQCL